MGGGGSSAPTAEQQQLMTQQALTTANLNLEENSQRKAILNAMQGTRLFRGSALSRAMIGNAPGAVDENAPPASQSQTTSSRAQLIAPIFSSLLDQQARGSGATPAGGAGASGGGGRAVGARGGPTGDGGGRR